MSRNRYFHDNVDTNMFRSNLMLLIQNFYPQGLPMEKLQSEYKKYFHEDITTTKMLKTLKLIPLKNQNAEDEETDEDVIWVRIFNIPCLYEFFVVEDVENCKTMIIKCRRGRTIDEMKALARIATLTNINYARSVKPRDSLELSICDTCDKITPKFADETETIVGLKRKSSSEESLASSKKKKVETVVIDIVDEPAAKLTRFELSESDEDDPTYFPEDVITRNLRSGLRSSRSPLKVSQRNKRSRLETSPVSYLIANSDTEEEQEASESNFENLDNSDITTVVLKNHLGETKTVKYFSAEHKCFLCDKSFGDKAGLLKHRGPCAKLRTCKICGTAFKTTMMLKKHNLECGNTAEPNSVVENITTNEETLTTEEENKTQIQNEVTITIEEEKSGNRTPRLVLIKYEEDLPTTT